MAKRRVRSQIANLTPDQKKSGIDKIYLAADNVRHIVEKLLMRATTLLETAL
jgi:methylmalonyl-CoA mutase cobalamin-binding subunit